MNLSSEIVVIIDDDADVGKIVSDVLEDNGYTAKHFLNKEDALAFIPHNDVSVIFLDLWFNNDESAGFSILNSIREINKKVPIIMISGHGNIDIAVKAIKFGAHDFVEKPFNIDKLLLVTERAAEITRLRKSNEELRTFSDLHSYLLGNSPEISRMRGLIKKSANSNSRVMINAGMGAGAEAIAQYIHENSSRKTLQFLSIDCRSEDQQGLDVEIFGSRTSKGALELLDNGTLMLSNIFELNRDLQSKLLKFLQSGNFTPYQATNYKESDTRIIGSCINLDIQSLIQEKKIREDLFFRIAVININVPPLRHRREDIPVLIHYFLDNSAKIFNIKSCGIEKDAVNALMAYDWPGNVRQLKNIIELSLVMSSGKTITLSDIPKDIFTVNEDYTNELSKLASMSLKEAREIFEKNYINMQIDRFSGNISQVANFIGMERSALHRKIKSLEISNTKYRGGDQQ